MLYTLAKIAKAELILELESAIGYSTIWFARAIEEFGGKVISVEVNKDTAKRARKHQGCGSIKRSGNN